MDEHLFDLATKEWVGSVRTRRLLIASGLLGGIAGGLGLLEADAKKKKKNPKTCPPGTVPYVRKKGKGKKKKVSTICIDDGIDTRDCSQKECGDPDGKGGYCSTDTCPPGKSCLRVNDTEMWNCYCVDLDPICPVGTCGGTYHSKCGFDLPCTNCGPDQMCISGNTACCNMSNAACQQDSDCCYHGQHPGRACINNVCTDQP
ncbi:MAG: hypothetical protein R2853_13030 [Thermomicrobiales bacterium]